MNDDTKPNLNTEVGGEVSAKTKEYTLKKPIRYRGESKKVGDKVVLLRHQADRLKEIGHI